ncbi:serine/threonine protein kinase [Blastopirellula marina]|uniref:Serine/threonine protein kinase n=1 Tax=Blastopirellula marina TaxID=124 RepID=A0A2S8F2M6_9BACT|nr:MULTISPECIES: serine/threonine-protein kinase [Pirellulaceae]PQO26399.1 serine/threonine protein kinase [Blastopirellula marina]RCS44855.1 serine/threonine protein kinase [Bremerella cremea]
MTIDPNLERLQQAFLAALEVPEDQRDDWLERECGSDAALLQNVRSLLGHANPNNDLLEQSPDKAIADFTLTDPDAPIHLSLSEGDDVSVDCEHFLSKLSEVGILSQAELDSVCEHRPEQSEMPDPRTLAAQLVQEGKLTQYQATALLRGEPELLIDKYLIVDLIDVGGMGMVFKAIHRGMDRVVAVKIISPKMLGSSDHVKRFRREVRVAATLEHPNVVRSYDADESRGINFLVMEYVRGKNLRQIVRESGPMSLDQAVDSIRQAAVGLDYAHQHGVIHRDIKPGNLLLNNQGTLKILDLGLAHVDESLRQLDTNGVQSRDASVIESEITSAGMILGTASFMAPEQSLNSHLVDARTDIYSLGCTLFYLLTGDPVYQGDTVFQVLVRHRESEIPSICEMRADVPESLNTVFQRMVAKSPDDRFQSMHEVVEEIDACKIAPPKPAPRHQSRREVKKVDESVDPSADKSSEPESRSQARLYGTVSVLAGTIVAAFVLTSQWLPLWQGKTTDIEPSSVKTISAADLLATGNWSWQVQENLGPVINSREFEIAADMTNDGCTIVFTSGRESAKRGNRDLWIATRNSIDEEWEEPSRLPSEINSPDQLENVPRISGDGLTLRFHRGSTLMITTRSSAHDPWSEPTVDPLATLFNGNYQVTKDELTQFSYVFSHIDTDQQRRYLLRYRRRPSINESFDEFTDDLLPATMKLNGQMTLSNDGRLLIYSANTTPMEAKPVFRLFFITRSDWGRPWSSPQLLLPDLPRPSAAPAFVMDDKTLLLVNSDGDGQGAGDIWIARLKRNDDDRQR